MLKRYFKFKIQTEKFKENVVNVLKKYKGEKALFCGNKEGFKQLNKIYNFDKYFSELSFIPTDKMSCNTQILEESRDINNLYYKKFNVLIITEEDNPERIEYKIKDSLYLPNINTELLFNEKYRDTGRNMEYLLRYRLDKSLIKLKQRIKDKKVMFYGGGLFFKLINEYYDLSGLNIIGVADKKLCQKDGLFDVCGYKLYDPDDILNLKPEYIIITTRIVIKIANFVYEKYVKKTNIKILPLLQRSLFSMIFRG